MDGHDPICGKCFEPWPCPEQKKAANRLHKERRASKSPGDPASVRRRAVVTRLSEEQISKIAESSIEALTGQIEGAVGHMVDPADWEELKAELTDEIAAALDRDWTPA